MPRVCWQATFRVRVMIGGTLTLAAAYAAVGYWCFDLRKVDETDEIKEAKRRVMEITRKVPPAFAPFVCFECARALQQRCAEI